MIKGKNINSVNSRVVLICFMSLFYSHPKKMKAVEAKLILIKQTVNRSVYNPLKCVCTRRVEGYLWTNHDPMWKGPQLVKFLNVLNHFIIVDKGYKLECVGFFMIQKKRSFINWNFLYLKSKHASVTFLFVSFV